MRHLRILRSFGVFALRMTGSCTCYLQSCNVLPASCYLQAASSLGGGVSESNQPFDASAPKQRF